MGGSPKRMECQYQYRACLGYVNLTHLLKGNEIPNTGFSASITLESAKLGQGTAFILSFYFKRTVHYIILH